MRAASAGTRRKLFVVLAVLAAFLSISAYADSPTDTPVPEEIQAAKLIQELNQINPLVQHSPRPSGSPDPTFALPTIIDNKWVQKYLRVLSDPILQRDALALINSPQRVSFAMWEFGWVVFMLIFKVWRMTKAKGFWSVMFTQFWTFAVFLAGFVYFVPRYVLGPTYLGFLRALFRVFHG